MPLSTIFSVISWRSVSFGRGNWSTGENPQPVASHWQTLSHNIVSGTLAWVGLEPTTLLVKGTNGIGSCKSNCHLITTTTDTLRSSLQFVFMLSTTSPYSEYYTIKSRILKESSHPIFQNIFRNISTPCWKIFCQLRTDDERWHCQLDFGSKLTMCLTTVPYI
jgi:hypothetical protein